MKRKFISIFIALVLALSLCLVTAVPVAAVTPDTPTIDGFISAGEWDGAVEIDVAGTEYEGASMGTVKLLASTDYLYVLFEVLDSTDGRLAGRNDKIGLNINPTHGGPWGKPYDIVFQIGADPAAFTTPDPDIPGSSGNTDGYKTEWVINGEQLDLPEDLQTMTLYNGGTRISEWKVPLATIAPLPGDTLLVGGACDNLNVGDGSDGGTFSYPPNLVWDDASTYVDYSFKVENEDTGLYYQTIQAAINAATAGDTVNVEAGTYEENVVVDKMLTLQGEDRETTEIKFGYGAYPSEPPLIISADEVTVSGFTIRSGPYIEAAFGSSSGWAFTIIVDGDSALFTDLHVIKDLLLTYNDQPRDGGSAFWLAPSLEGFTLTVSTVVSEWNGIYAREEGIDITVRNVEFTYLGTYAIMLKQITGATIEGNKFTNTGNELGVLVSRGCEGIEIMDNKFTGSGSTDSSHIGILLQNFKTGPVGVSILGNDISDFDTGIKVEEGVATSGIQINYNNIYDNPEYGVLNEATEVDATSNWWGDASGPQHTSNLAGNGDIISDGITYAPWYIDEARTTLTPVYNVTKETYHHAIQAGINAADPNDTITVADGTYDEKLTITKPLILIGEGLTRPMVNIPDGDDAGVTITASDVTVENIHFYRQDRDGWANCIINIPRGGSWGTYTIEYERITFRNVLFEGAARGAFITAGDLTVEGCEFKGQLDDALYFAAVSGTTLISGNRFEGDTESTVASRKAILFENFSTGDPAVSGTIRIESNVVDGTTNLLVYNQWIHRDGVGPVDIRVVGNIIHDLESYEGWDDIGSAVVIFGADVFGKVGSVVVQKNDFSGVPEDRYGVLGPPEVEVDATLNWWGNPNGPSAIAFSTYPVGTAVSGDVDYSPWLPDTWQTYYDPVTFAEIHSDNDGFSDLEEYWLGTDHEDELDFPGATIDPGQVDTAYVEGDDQANLQDSEGGTIADVDISDAPEGASGTITGARYTEDPSDAGLSIGTGTTGVAFLDVKVTGYTEGIARITVPYPDTDNDGFVDNTDPPVLEHTLSLYYWDDAANTWSLADNNEVDTVLNTVSGDIPVSALTGTPVGTGGYLEDEALVAIESILNLNYSVEGAIGGTVNLTIDTNTAFLGAATIDLTFDPRVVEVVAWENGVFDILTVNTSYAIVGNDTQIARFVVYQDQDAGEGIDATGDVVVAVVKLNAVGSTMDVSPLILEVITLTDNKGDTIPSTLGTNDSIAIVGGIGDANRDGVVDVFDCVYSACAIAGFPGWSIDTPTMDVSGDDMVNAWDCTYLAWHLTGDPNYPLGG